MPSAESPYFTAFYFASAQDLLSLHSATAHILRATLSRHWSVGSEMRLWPCRWSSQAKCPRLPIWSRAAIQASGVVVCKRNCQASSTFLGSPLRRALRSASLQPIRVHGVGTKARNSRARLSNPLTIVLTRRKIRRPTGGGPKQAV